MRVKTEDRRQAIMKAALSVFREVGYEGASMSEISMRAGGSKATLYSYFKSKSELYTETMLDTIASKALEINSILDPSKKDIAETLRAFGTTYLEIILSPDVIANKRTAVSQSCSSDLGSILYERGERRAWAYVEAYLAHLIAAGELKPSNPMIAALHFQGLLECGMLEPCLFGAAPLRKIEDAVASAVEAFMIIYDRRAPSST
jgi:AcrR family transcriptional regulator